MSIPPPKILNCKVGDVIQYHSPMTTSYTVLALIIGEAHRRGYDRWIIQPLGNSDRKPYMVKKRATVWKKVA